MAAARENLTVLREGKGVTVAVTLDGAVVLGRIRSRSISSLVRPPGSPVPE